jgi:hypothetical protein
MLIGIVAWDVSDPFTVDASSWQCEHLQQMSVHGSVNTYSRSQFMAV